MPRRNRRSSRTRAAGSTRASGTARISDKLYVEARYGDFGYYFPLYTNSPDNFFWHDSGRLVSEGAHQKQQLDRDRKQYTGAATYFLDTAAGSHTFKLGGGVPAGEVVGRLRVAPRRHQQHRADLQQRRLDAGDLRHPDRVVPGRIAGRARLPGVDRRARPGRRRSSPTPGRSAGPRSTSASATTAITPGCPEQEQLAGTRRPGRRRRRRRSPRRTSTPGTRSRRASAWSTTWPATAGRC